MWATRTEEAVRDRPAASEAIVQADGQRVDRVLQPAVEGHSVDGIGQRKVVVAEVVAQTSQLPAEPYPARGNLYQRSCGFNSSGRCW